MVLPEAVPPACLACAHCYSLRCFSPVEMPTSQQSSSHIDACPGCQQRHLEPSEDHAAGDAPLAKPLAVATGAAALPHPEKVEAGARAVSRRHEGWAGEDAYFCATGR